MTPNDQISALFEYFLFFNISGAEYFGVDTIVFVYLNPPSKVFDMPKYPNFAIFSLIKKYLKVLYLYVLYFDYEYIVMQDKFV